MMRVTGTHVVTVVHMRLQVSGDDGTAPGGFLGRAWRVGFSMKDPK
jgi:hypothetical protein